MTDLSEQPLIPGRVILIGEGGIPQEIIETLTDAHLQVFMREPDPDKWPSEMRHLAEYLPGEEEVKFIVSSALGQFQGELNAVLERWASSLWANLAEKGRTSSAVRELAIEEMTRILRRLLSERMPPP